MTLSGKGSRRIRVGDATYRWTVSPDSGYLVLVVEAEGGGQRLLVSLPYLDVYSDETGTARRQLTVVSPGVVRRCILRGVRAGWKATERGSPFSIQMDASDLGDASGHLKPA